jgi:hypothetical protein
LNRKLLAATMTSDAEAAAELIALCGELIEACCAEGQPPLGMYRLAIKLRKRLRDELRVRGMGDAG